jgi:hypothetical protein
LDLNSAVLKVTYPTGDGGLDDLAILLFAFINALSNFNLMLQKQIILIRHWKSPHLSIIMDMRSCVRIKPWPRLCMISAGGVPGRLGEGRSSASPFILLSGFHMLHAHAAAAAAG